MSFSAMRPRERDQEKVRRLNDKSAVSVDSGKANLTASGRGGMPP